MEIEKEGLVRIAIVEDDALAERRLEDCLCRYETEYGIGFSVVHYGSGFEFLERWACKADIVFMDVDMPGMNGIETARRMRETGSEAVLMFVTNLAQYAIEGYSVDALDYVLKPVEYFAFKLKIQKALRSVAVCTDRVIQIMADDQTHYLKSSEIQYVEVEKHSLTYHTTNGALLGEGSLKNVEQALEGLPFYRCNYCYLVNLQYVSSVGNAEVHIGNTVLQLSRSRRKPFMEQLTNYYSKGGRSK